MAFKAIDSSMCWYLAVRPQKGPSGAQNCQGGRRGAMPIPAGAEAWLAVIRQGAASTAKSGEDREVRMHSLEERAVSRGSCVNVCVLHPRATGLKFSRYKG